MGYSQIDSTFWSDLLSRIEPTQTEKNGAQRSHSYLRDALDTGEMQRRIVDSYLTGSYARHTAIRPQDDVDIVFVIDPTRWKIPFLRSYPVPEEVLQTFARAIRNRYESSSVRIQRRSIRLQLFHLNIDVVPAIPQRDDESVLIPDTENDEWILSRPKRHTRLTSEINRLRNGDFKPLVKVVKAWNAELAEGTQFKSFAIETIAAILFRRKALRTFQEAILRFFDFVAHCADERALFEWDNRYGISLDWWDTKIPDLAETGSNLAANVTDDRRRKFVAAAIRSRDLLEEANRACFDHIAQEKIRRALGL